MNLKKFALVGGDYRNLSLAKLLEEEGYEVTTFALSETDSATLDMTIQEADVVIAPIPFTNDGKTLNTPLYQEQIYINDFLKSLKGSSLLISGKLDEPIIRLCSQYLLNTIDILQREDFSVLNAIPTAEGAIQIAMQETPFTLSGSNILITGYGRVGKVLAQMLKGLSANVFIATKPFEEKAYSLAFGFKNIDFSNLKDYIHEMNLIINTVPAKVLSHEILSVVAKKCIIIDLASKPGGLDFEKAKELGIKTIWALSLPGKVAPDTSAKIIRDTVFNIVKEMEV